MTIGEFIDELTYQCYVYNRLRSPDIKPEQWAGIFNNVEALEKRFQTEVK